MNLLVLLMLAGSMNTDSSFIHKVLNDFSLSSNFLLLKTADNKKVIITNSDFYYYYHATKNINKEEDYIRIAGNILLNDSTLSINDTQFSTFDFIKVVENESVNNNAKKGFDEFVKIYFLRGKVLRTGITDEERTAIIQKLFEWGIPTKIDDETGYLIISQ